MSAALLSALFFASCSDSPSDLIEYVPRESKAVMVFRPADLAEKADVQKFGKKFAQGKNDKKALNMAMELFGEDSGINMEQAVLFEYEEAGYLAFIIDDEKKFAKTELIDGYTSKVESGDLPYYEVDDTDGHVNIVLDGKKAWLAIGDMDVDDAVDAVKKFTSLDKDKKITSEPGFTDNMKGGDVALYVNMESVMDMVGSRKMSKEMINNALSAYGISANDIHLNDIMSSRIYSLCTIGKDDLKITVKVLDEKGENLMSKIAGTTGTVDAGMLKFFDKGTNFVYAATIPDYTKRMYSKMVDNVPDETMKLIVEQLVDNIGDNMAVGVTLNRNFRKTETYDWGYGTESYERFDPAALGLTVVVKCKKNMSSDLSNFAAMSGLPMAADSTSAGSSVILPIDSDMVLRVKADGNYLIISNREATTSPMSDPGFFSGKQAAMFLNMSKNSSVSAGIRDYYGADLDLTALAYSDKEQGVFEVKVNNNKQKSPIAYMLDIMLGLI